MNARALLDRVGDGVVATGADGRVEYVNEAACEMLGVRPDTAAGQLLAFVVRDHRLETACLEGGFAEVQLRGRTLLGRGVPGGLLLTDVTDSRAAREDARELLSVLSHELRTPVTTISSALEALSRDELPAERRERFLELASAETARLVRLLNDLTVDVKPPQQRSVALPDAVERALTLLRPRLAERNIAADTVGLAELTVLADPDKLLQSLVNLIENAALHGPADATIHVAASRDGDVVRVTVSDEGTPLEASRMDELFSPDSRGRAIKARGTGLGLYIVRSIAQRSGGEAWGRPLEHGNEFGFSVRIAP